MDKICNEIFKGTATAIITPFKNGKVDFESYGNLIDKQIESGISAIVVCGTTGEASTMDYDEHLECIKFAVERARKRVPVIAGTGSNCTKKAIYLSKKACDLGVDALLIITPYYNKATPEGLINHFTAVADSVDKPIILYNVPSRTGVNIPIEVYKVLANHKNIVGVKEASGNLSSIALLLLECGEKLAVYSGNDDQILPILALGGSGVISVVSNIMPEETQNLCSSFFGGDIKSARKIQLELINIISVLFCEVNPIPLKYAMSIMNLCTGEVRLPLTAPNETSKTKIRETLRRYDLI